METKKEDSKKQVKANVNDTQRDVKAKEFLPYHFTEQELKDFSGEMARAAQAKDALEKEKTAATSNYKAKIDGRTAEILALATKINNKMEHRTIDCTLRMNYPKATRKTLMRNDTAEVVWEKPMTSEELQLKLDIDNQDHIASAMVEHNNDDVDKVKDKR